MKKLFKELFRLRPFLFSTFYQRAKLVQMRPVPVRAFLNLEVTRACCLKCDFCLAAGKDKGHLNTPLSLLLHTLELFEGVERVVLLGGEPFMHPEFEKIIEAVASIGAKTEIYTNGFLLGGSTEEVKRRCIQIGSKNPRGTIFTLAMDSAHAVQLGYERLGALLDGTLGAQKESPHVMVRFNVTDERIGTSDYLSPNLVLDILEKIHPTVLREFTASVSRGDTWEKFLFNAVVRMGRAEEQPYLSSVKSVPEFLRASDLAKNVELTAVMDNEHGMGIYSWLNAMWMEPCPQALRISRIEQDLDKELSREKLKVDFRQFLARNVYGLRDDIFDQDDRDRIMKWLLGENNDIESLTSNMDHLLVDTSMQYALDLLRTYEGERDPESLRIDFSNILISRHRWRLLDGWYKGDTSVQISEPVLEYLLEDKGPPVDLGSFFKICPFPLEVLCKLVTVYHRKFPERSWHLVNDLLQELAEHSRQVPLVYDTTMAQWMDFPVEASNSSIDTGVSLLGNLLQIRLMMLHLVAWPGKGLQVRFPGLKFKRGSSPDAAAGWGKILDLVGVVFPKQVRELFSKAFCEHPGFCGLPSQIQRRLESWTKGQTDLSPEQDPIRVFESLTYEPNSDYIPWDDKTLSSMIEKLGLTAWPKEYVKMLLERSKQYARLEEGV